MLELRRPPKFNQPMILGPPHPIRSGKREQLSTIRQVSQREYSTFARAKAAIKREEAARTTPKILRVNPAASVSDAFTVKIMVLKTIAKGIYSSQEQL